MSKNRKYSSKDAVNILNQSRRNMRDDSSEGFNDVRSRNSSGEPHFGLKKNIVPNTKPRRQADQNVVIKDDKSFPKIDKLTFDPQNQS